MEETRTFIFSEKNGNASIILSAKNYEDALEYLDTITANKEFWRVENEEGDQE